MDIVPPSPKKGNLASDSRKYAVAGMIGGIAAKFVEHPLDTVKVRLQATEVAGQGLIFTTPTQCIRETFKKEGIRGFYKGLTSPLLGSTIESGISFFIYGTVLTHLSSIHFGTHSTNSTPQNATSDRLSNSMLTSTAPVSPPSTYSHNDHKPDHVSEVHKDHHNDPQHHPHRHHPPHLPHIEVHLEHVLLWQHFVAGGMAGVCTGFALTPMDLIKSRLQVQQNQRGTRATYSGPIDCLIQVLKANGIRGLWRGLPASWARDIPGNTLWFGASGAISQVLTPHGELEPPIWAKIFAGSTAGVLFWSVPYPFDMIKSRLQVQQQKSTVKAVALDIYRQHGIRGFYQGLSVCVVRTIPTSAVLYTVATLVNRYL